MSLSYQAVSQLFDSPLFQKQYSQGDDPNAHAALPDFSLQFLVDLCKQQGIKRVFEFGSGRSTKALLEIGCAVTSLEDSQYWMDQTLATLTDEETSHHTSFVSSLKTRMLGGFPVLDWEVEPAFAPALKSAELVLVDSPYYTPFRESTLWTALNCAENALVVLDDTRIPTLSHFCNSIAGNKNLLHKRVMVGHGFDVFYVIPEKRAAGLSLNHTPLDIAKGWNRFRQGKKFYADLAKKA